MKVVLLKLFLAMVITLFFFSGCAGTSTTSGTKHVSTMDIKQLMDDHNRNLYQVTCDNGTQHRIIFNPAEQDYQFYSPAKGGYIKHYDARFADLIYFSRWVCRNK